MINRCCVRNLPREPNNSISKDEGCDLIPSSKFFTYRPNSLLLLWFITVDVCFVCVVFLSVVDKCNNGFVETFPLAILRVKSCPL